MAYPKVVIIILNWNGWIDTIECLESLYRITYPNYEIIVVDNGSENESVEKIKNYALGNIKSSSYYFEYCLDNKPIKYIKGDYYGSIMTRKVIQDGEIVTN